MRPRSLLHGPSVKKKARAKRAPVQDEFGELPGRKRESRALAESLGHSLKKWHRRPNDPEGRWNAFCTTCNALAVVAVDPPAGFPAAAYGSALTRRCRS